MLNYYIFNSRNEMLTWGQIAKTLYMDSVDRITEQLAADAANGYINSPAKLLLTQAATTMEPPLTAVYKWDGKQWNFASNA